MWLDKLEYRDSLGLPEDLTFGIEIEFAKARRKYIEEELNDLYKKGIINSKWDLKYEETIFGDQEISYTKGGEAVSTILHDSKNTWDNIKYTCDTIKLYNGIANNNCGSHVHIGVNILKDNMKYYDRLIKLYVIYEDILLRFCYGEDNKPRDTFKIFAQSPYNLFKIFYEYFYDDEKFNLSFDKFLYYINNINNKNISLSFCRLSKEFLERKYHITDNWYNYRTLEFRAGNGTLNPAIWQNYINLYTKLLLCCTNDKKDWSKVNKEFENSIYNEELDKFNINKAINFADFIFNSSLDKNNFMLQYIKDEKNTKTKRRSK